MQEQDHKRSARSPLPALANHPLVLLLTIVVPNVFLLWFNLNNYHLISGEVNSEERSTCLWIFIGQILLIIIGVGIATLFLRKKILIPWGIFWIPLAVFSVYLVAICFHIEKAIPDSLEIWIAQPGTILGAQFVGMTPAICLSALALACFKTRWAVGWDIGFSLAAAIGVPVAWYVFTQIMWRYDSWFNGQIFQKLFMLFFVISSLVCMAGVIRLLSMTYNMLQRRGPIGRAIMIFIVAVAGPVGGLLLNREIPFPSNLQSPYIYTLAILNGLILLIPRLKGFNRLNKASWFAQCLLFPFSLYFFIVFLPWLPMSILAIIAAGSGFLILVPTLLFIIHLKKIVEGVQSKAQLVVAIIATLLIPTYLYLECQLDRRVLHQAIDYFYTPNYDTTGDRFAGNRTFAKRSLNRLNKIKHGHHLPYLTQTYNNIVLDNLVLNDTKLKHIYSSIFGEPIATVEHLDDDIIGGMFGTNSGNRGNTRLASPPPTGVTLKNLSHQHTQADGYVKTLVKLEMYNPIRSQAEFATKIEIPDGTFVSGYWLNVEGDRVPGQIFERKTAMWIYRMIRDATRRDPGLLSYQTPNRLSLRVFPFAHRQTRITEIEFITPVELANEITIGSETISPPNQSKPTIITQRSADDSIDSFHFSLAAQEQLPKHTRKAYLHFVIDRSTNGPSLDSAIAAGNQFIDEHPSITQCQISFANYEIVDLTPTLIPVTQFESTVRSRADALPNRGGFLGQRAIQRSLYQADEQCPLIAVISDAEPEQKRSDTMSWFDAILPDFSGYYFINSKDGKVSAHNFDGQRRRGLSQQPVHLFKLGENLIAAPANTGKSQSIYLPKNEKPLEVYNPDQQRFELIKSVSAAPSPEFEAAVSGWFLDRSAKRNPALTNQHLSEIVVHSRESGILLPSTAYIVVENSAQWKMLKKKEKDKLKGNQGLDHMETPEPAWWFALLVYLVGVVIYRLRKKRHHTVATFNPLR